MADDWLHWATTIGGMLGSAAVGAGTLWAMVRGRQQGDADAAAARSGRRMTDAMMASSAIIDRLERQVASLQVRADAAAAEASECRELAGRQDERIKHLQDEVDELRHLRTEVGELRQILSINGLLPSTRRKPTKPVGDS